MEQTGPEQRHHSLHYKLAYAFLLVAVSGWILLIFLRPEPRSVGINQYERSMFLDMVEGKAYRPFVYRVLLPTTTRVVTNLTPDSVTDACSRFVEQNIFLSGLFGHFRWETSAAYQYTIASLLMLLSFMGFAHYASKFSLHVCGIDSTYRNRSVIAVIALLGLPAFFAYTAFPYDPPQLFLFTLSLYLLARQRIAAFALAFGLCTLNKETSVLLILVFAFTVRKWLPRRQYMAYLAGFVVWYVLVRALIAYLFRNNPGSFVEFHLLDHNLRLLVSEWGFSDLVTWLILLGLVFYRWEKKPEFLRVSFVVVLAPLVILTLFLGLLNEWRDYYEAYPLALALSVDTVYRIDSALRIHEGEQFSR